MNHISRRLARVSACPAWSGQPLPLICQTPTIVLGPRASLPPHGGVGFAEFLSRRLPIWRRTPLGMKMGSPIASKIRPLSCTPCKRCCGHRTLLDREMRRVAIAMRSRGPGVGGHWIGPSCIHRRAVAKGLRGRGLGTAMTIPDLNHHRRHRPFLSVR